MLHNYNNSDKNIILVCREREHIIDRCSSEFVTNLESAYAYTDIKGSVASNDSSTAVKYLSLMDFSSILLHDAQVFDAIRSTASYKAASLTAGSNFDRNMNLSTIHESGIHEYNERPWVLLTSRNSVPALSGLSKDRFRFAAVGKATAEAMETAGYAVEFIPSEAYAEVFAKEFDRAFLKSEPDQVIVLLLGDTASVDMRDYLLERGRNFIVFESYKVVKKSLSENERNSVLKAFILLNEKKLTPDERSIKAVFFSPLQVDFFLIEMDSIVDDYLSRIGIVEKISKDQLVKQFLSEVIAYSIGKKTTKRLLEQGFLNIETAEEQEIPELMKLLMTA